jgi:glycosyltransferase involved in cell wall biosynthesis
MKSGVSVIIPVYNRLHRACKAVESVLKQTAKPDEIIVVDDGSEKDLSTLLLLVESNGGRLIRTQNNGPGAARNTGVSISSCEWVAFLDSDDLWLPHKLASLVAFSVNCNCDLVHSDERWIRSGCFVNAGKRHKKAQGDQAFLQSLELCCISPSAVMLRRELFESVGGFDEKLRVCEDYDLWLRITAHHEVGFLPEVLIEKHGGHADQLSRSAVAIDRFRVYSLAKLFLNDIALTNEQREAVFCVLSRKCKILAVGADKRAIRARRDYFSSFPERLIHLSAEEVLPEAARELLMTNY